MKIFNWMHKKFHHQNNTLNKDGYASNMKKNEPTTINKVDSHQALLKQVAMTDFLGGWRDGILTIGTLGCDPLKSINHHKEYFALEAEDEKVKVGHTNDDDVENFYNAEQEELNPLMYNTFEHNFEDVICEKKHDDEKEEEVVTINSTLSEIVQVEPMICHEIIEYNDDVEEAEQKKKGGERITLADLFLADSDVKLKLDYPKVLFESIEKGPNLKAKHGFSFAKKFIPLVKDNARPMKDIKKLMKKMLKRKIHPDLHKAEGEEVSTEGGHIIDNNNMIEGNGSSYFLPI